jgi:TetR/AcrR family transcriptional regulator, cholesterol catabolism regulator
MEQPETSRERIIRMAISLFAARGFRGTSIRDIASAMNMSISNIYHYFGNKEGLLVAILEDASKRLLERLNQVRSQDLPPIERFRELVKTHIQLSMENNDQGKIFSLDEEHLSPEGEKVNREIQRSILKIYREELGNLQQHGYLRHRSLTVLTFNVLGVINWQLKWYRLDGPLTFDEVANEIVNFILYGVLGGPKEATAEQGGEGENMSQPRGAGIIQEH